MDAPAALYRLVTTKGPAVRGGRPCTCIPPIFFFLVTIAAHTDCQEIRKRQCIGSLAGIFLAWIERAEESGVYVCVYNLNCPFYHLPFDYFCLSRLLSLNHLCTSILYVRQVKRRASRGYRHMDMAIHVWVVTARGD